MILQKSFKNTCGMLIAGAMVFYAQSCSAPKSNPATKTVSASQTGETDVFAEHIRTSKFRTPEEEKQSFRLPPGFEITLFASEPDITKPINMEFDDRGRLWVTQSSEYPVAAGEGEGKDRITILEDKNGDGKADTFTNFDSNLNIPIGIMPMSDGAISYSIPNLYYFKDDNNDGKADSKKVLLSGFGFKDTHGMVNNLMRGYDGWLHVCHGFSNTSNIAGTDGDSVKMVSGNTFRVKLDGSRVEQTTFGRVNPFGFAYDDKGFLYSVDCHTKPITQLIFGGDYPHFGKKTPAGLGFAPVMMDYNLGSTALAGLVYYTGNHFPKEYQNSFYTGDVVTCRIDRNTISFNGSTPVSKKEEPFLVSSDPWFRPVDVKLGPDGALYIADFYNRIIGHYEVALNHPGRDRISGRIWKITYKGAQENQMPVIDWSAATIEKLLEGLTHPQINTRLKVADRLVDTWKEKAIEPAKKILNGEDKTAAVHALWILHRLDALDETGLANALKDSDPTVRVHAFRILKEQKTLSEAHYNLVVNAVSTSENPFEKRVAAEVLGQFPRIENLSLLFNLHQKTDSLDSHLKYTALIAARSNLKNPGVMWRLPALQWTDDQLALISKVLLDIPSSAGASFVLDYTLNHEIPSVELIANLEYIGRHVSPYQLDKAIDLINEKFAGAPETQLSLYKTIRAGVRQSGSQPGPKLVAWGTQLSTKFLSRISENTEIVKNGLKDKPGEKPDPKIAREYALMNAQRIAALEIAGEYQVKPLEIQLQEMLKAKWLEPRVRAASASALMHLNAKDNVALVAKVLQDPAEVPLLREKLATVLELAPSPSVFQILKKQMSSGARNLQVAIATVLSSTQQGIDYLLNAFKDQEANIDIANEIPVKERFDINANSAQKKHMEAFLAMGSDERAERQKLIDSRIADFKPTGAVNEFGKSVFVQNCSGCHTIQGSGGLVGPQLDGIGNWGHKALTQKILDPNRNITEAFRTYNIVLKNDQTLTGLYRRTEGEAIVFADLTGKEFSVAKNEMKEYRASRYTLMPDQFKSIIPEKEFYALVDYLLSIK